MSSAAARPSGEAKARSTASQSGQVTSTTWWYVPADWPWRPVHRVAQDARQASRQRLVHLAVMAVERRRIARDVVGDEEPDHDRPCGSGVSTARTAGPTCSLETSVSSRRPRNNP